MKSSFVGPGGSFWSQPPKTYALVPTTLRLWPERFAGASPTHFGSAHCSEDEKKGGRELESELDKRGVRRKGAPLTAVGRVIGPAMLLCLAPQGCYQMNERLVTHRKLPQVLLDLSHGVQRLVRLCRWFGGGGSESGPGVVLGGLEEAGLSAQQQSNYATEKKTSSVYTGFLL